MKTNRNVLLLVFLGGLLFAVRPAEASIGMGNYFHELLYRVESILQTSAPPVRDKPVLTAEPEPTGGTAAARRTQRPRRR